MKWLGTGLTVAGAVLPAVGFAILLRYLPVKKHIAYLIMGFTFTTLFSVLFTSIQTLGTGLQAANKMCIRDRLKLSKSLYSGSGII